MRLMGGLLSVPDAMFFSVAGGLFSAAGAALFSVTGCALFSAAGGDVNCTVVCGGVDRAAVNSGGAVTALSCGGAAAF